MMLRKEFLKETCFSLFLLSFVTQLANGQGPPTPQVNVRLAGGSTSGRDGRVEIQYQGVWGTICDDGWTVRDAGVICRMLGYIGAALAIPGTSGPYGPGTGPVFLRAVQCDGNEPTIAACPYQGWGSLSPLLCPHTQDAGVACLGDYVPTTTTSAPRTTLVTSPPRICTNPSQNVRLVTATGAAAVAEGRVQVFFNNAWRGICNDRWGVVNAAIICRMLCYNPANARAILGNSQYGNSTEGYALSGVNCVGTETDIMTCPRAADAAAATCSFTQPAAVSCLQDTPTPPPLPAPVVACDGERILAGFSRSADPLLQNQYLSIAGPGGSSLVGCNYVTYNDTNTVYISIPWIGACNTLRQTNDSYIIYTNFVRYAVPSASNIITRTDFYNVTVYCVVNRTQAPDSAFNPQSRTPSPQSGNSRYNVSLLLFANNQFAEVVRDNPLRVTLGDWLYVGVQLFSSDPNLKLVLVDLYVTPYQQPNVSPMYYLLQNNCLCLRSYGNHGYETFRIQTYSHSWRWCSCQCNRNCQTIRRRRDVESFTQDGRQLGIRSGFAIFVVPKVADSPPSPVYVAVITAPTTNTLPPGFNPTLSTQAMTSTSTSSSPFLNRPVASLMGGVGGQSLLNDGSSGTSSANIVSSYFNRCTLLLTTVLFGVLFNFRTGSELLA